MEIVKSKDGRFPSFLILRPSQRLIKQMQRRLWNALTGNAVSGLSLKWEIVRCTGFEVSNGKVLDIYAVYEGEDNSSDGTRNS